jgi:hypothetical protein
MRKQIFLQIYSIIAILLIVIFSTCFTFAAEKNKQTNATSSRSISISLYTDVSLSFGRDFLFKQTFYDIDPSSHSYRRNERYFSLDKEGMDLITGIRFSLRRVYAEASLNNIFEGSLTDNKSPEFWRARLGFSYIWNDDAFDFGFSTIQSSGSKHDLNTTGFSSTYKHNYESVGLSLTLAYSHQQIKQHKERWQSVDLPNPKLENVYLSIRFTAPRGHFRPYLEFTGAMLRRAKEVFVIPNYASLITVGFQLSLNKDQPILSGTNREFYPKTVTFD